MEVTDWPVRFSVASGTHIGLKRELNEDSLLAQFPVFIVADGMGGHQAGEVASKVVVETFLPLVGRVDIEPDQIFAAVDVASAEVTHLSAALLAGAGTTLAGLVAVSAQANHLQWLVVNIGDSRVYRLIGDRLQRLTTDHSFVQELVDAGDITLDEAVFHANRNIITKALGDGESEPDFWTTPITPGERMLVVSDGAIEGLTDSELENVMRGEVGAKEVVSVLIDLALKRGGTDNISVIVVDVEGRGETREAPPLTSISSEPLEKPNAFSFELPNDTTAPRQRPS